jgi:hypothetical protein
MPEQPYAFDAAWTARIIQVVKQVLGMPAGQRPHRTTRPANPNRVITFVKVTSTTPVDSGSGSSSTRYPALIQSKESGVWLDLGACYLEPANGESLYRRRYEAICTGVADDGQLIFTVACCAGGTPSESGSSGTGSTGPPPPVTGIITTTQCFDPATGTIVKCYTETSPATADCACGSGGVSSQCPPGSIPMVAKSCPVYEDTTPGGGGTGGTSSDTCGHCTVLPNSYTVTVSGISSGSQDCSAVDGTYTLVHQSGTCSWKCDPFLSPALWQLSLSGDTWSLVYSTGLVSYQKADADWNCLGSNVLAKAFEGPSCVGWPDEIQIDPV